jgi:hypothetical protein
MAGGGHTLVETADEAAPPPASRAAAITRRKLPTALALLVLLTATTLTVYSYFRGRPSAGTAAIGSIAVLPLKICRAIPRRNISRTE